MGLASGIRAGAAYVEIGANNSELVKALNAAQAKLRAFAGGIEAAGRGLSNIGGAALLGLGGAVAIFTRYGSELNDMAARTGMGVGALSEMGAAAKLAGADMETIETATRKMQTNLVAAAGGSRQAKDALQRLGLTVQDLERMAPEDQMQLIGDRLAKIENPAARAALAVEIFGKSGTKLLPLLTAEGDATAALRDFGEEARRLGALPAINARINSGQAAGALQTLRLEAGALQQMGPEQQLETIGRALLAIEDPAQRAAAANGLLGDAAGRLLPRIEAAAGGLRGARAQARALGLTMDADTVAAADRLGDAFDILGMLGRRTSVSIGAALAPALTEISATLARVIGNVNRWLDANRGSVQGFATFAAAAFLAGRGLIAIGGGLRLLTAGLAAPKMILTAITGAFSLAATLAAALLSPLGLIAVAVAGVVTWFFRFTEAGQNAFASLSETFRQFTAFFGESWQGVVDAVAAGDLAAAWEVVAATMQVVWQTVVLWFQTKWAEFSDWFASYFGLTVADVFANVRQAWNATIAHLRRSWAEFSALFQRAQNAIATGAGNLATRATAWVLGVDEDVLRTSLGQGRREGQQQAAAIDANLANANADINAQADADRARIEEDRVRRNAAAGAPGGPNPEVEAAAAALEDAQARRRAAIEAAAAARAAIPALPGGAAPAAGAREGLDAFRQGPSSRGSFSAFGLQGWGARTQENEMVDAQEAGNAELARIRQILQQQGRLAFA